MKKNKKAGNAMLSSISDLLIAGDERIELPPKVLETPIIPFDQSPMFCFCCNYTYKRHTCQDKMLDFAKIFIKAVYLADKVLCIIAKSGDGGI